METLIAKLLQDFEQGKMNRRQLVQSLSVAAAAASVPTTVLGRSSRRHGEARGRLRQPHLVFLQRL